MAHDDRHDRDRYDRDRATREARERALERERERARDDGPPWVGGGAVRNGWGDQAPRPQRLGDRAQRPSDDPDYGQEDYPRGPAGNDYTGDFGGSSTDPDSFFGAVGYDPEFGGPRFDRINVGSTGTHGVHPVSSVYGADYRGAVGVLPSGNFRSSARRYAIMEGQGRQGVHDPHYAEWRRRQIEQLDRDYDEYCREHQSRFEQEFGAWREQRGRQRQAVGSVREHMEVVGSDGGHVGTVDCTRGDAIVLNRSDPNAGGLHHAIPCGWVETVDDKVRLNLAADEAMQRWHDEERSAAMFESESDAAKNPGHLYANPRQARRDDQ